MKVKRCRICGGVMKLYPVSATWVCRNCAHSEHFRPIPREQEGPEMAERVQDSLDRSCKKNADVWSAMAVTTEDFV